MLRMAHFTEAEHLYLLSIPDGMHPADVPESIIGRCAAECMTQRAFLTRMVNLVRRELYELQRRDLDA